MKLANLLLDRTGRRYAAGARRMLLATFAFGFQGLVHAQTTTPISAGSDL